MGHDVLGLGPDAGQFQQSSGADALPGLVQGAPLGNAVKVGVNGNPVQFGKLFPVQGNFAIHDAKHSESPGADVNLGTGAVGEDGKALAQELARRHPVAPVGRFLNLVGPLKAKLRFQFT